MPQPNATPSHIHGHLLDLPKNLFHISAQITPNNLSVVDLFAGAGGFSLGFERAGFSVAAAVEMDNWACDTLRLNHQGTQVFERDIATMSDSELRAIHPSPDVLIGGPPCQGFSVSNNRAGDPKDPRNSLFRHFVRYAELCKPRVLLMENVPGLLKRKDANKRHVIEAIKEELHRIGYHPHVQVLHAYDYGVPQIRPRLFVMGLRAESENPFPEATHGKDGTDELTLFERNRLPHTTLWQAISDMPVINAREGTEEMEYSGEPQNSLQETLRAGAETLYNHKAMRHSQRLVARFASLSWGQSSADAPPELRARRRGNNKQLSGKDYDQNNRRMHPDKPCHTLPASFYANFVHPYQHRNFTPREGARIQSFPDWYRFCGKPTVVSRKLLTREGRDAEKHLCQYNQIGNAVPPVLSYRLAQKVAEHLSSEGTE